MQEATLVHQPPFYRLGARVPRLMAKLRQAGLPKAVLVLLVLEHHLPENGDLIFFFIPVLGT